MEINYKDILEDVIKNLNYEISQQKDMSSISYIVAQSLAGMISEEDRVELRGYYKGLKVAKEVIHRVLCMYSELYSSDVEECEQCALYKICQIMEDNSETN